MKKSYLETFVLEDSLDGSIFTGWRKLGLKDNAERAISNNLALSVLQISSLAGDTILNSLADDLYDLNR